jgi:hypothetical protein
MCGMRRFGKLLENIGNKIGVGGHFIVGHKKMMGEKNI